MFAAVFKDASVFGDTNLELPSFLSNQSIVEVHLDAALNNSAGKEIVLEFKIEIPLHARYPVSAILNHRRIFSCYMICWNDSFA